MKTLSLKMDDSTFSETEEIAAQLNLPRNSYINEAVNIYNQFNKQKILKNKFSKESKLTTKESLKVLHEFEKYVDGD